LLAARPDLRQPAEAYAAQVMSGADRLAVADDVEGLDIEELNTRADYQPGRGYVHPAEAADEILDEVLQPFLDDLQRRADFGMRSAAVELATGILLGLYHCRRLNSSFRAAIGALEQEEFLRRTEPAGAAEGFCVVRSLA